MIQFHDKITYNRKQKTNHSNHLPQRSACIFSTRYLFRKEKANVLNFSKSMGIQRNQWKFQQSSQKTKEQSFEPPPTMVCLYFQYSVSAPKREGQRFEFQQVHGNPKKSMEILNSPVKKGKGKRILLVSGGVGNRRSSR